VLTSKGTEMERERWKPRVSEGLVKTGGLGCRELEKH